MKILAIDTTTLTGSVALLDGSDPIRLLGEFLLPVTAVHSEKLLPAIERLLSDTGHRIEEVDLFAVAHGPGSFTGLRIGIATVQGLILATGKPAVGVSSLEALAMNGIFFPGLIVPMLDARRGEIYTGIFRGNGEGRVEEERAVRPETWVEELARRSEQEMLFLGPGARVYRELIVTRLGVRAQFAPPTLDIARAGQVGLLAAGKKLGKIVTPRYLRSAAVTFPRNSP